MFIFLIGLFCFLLVIGFFATSGESSLSFAVMAMIALGALAFVGFIGMMAYMFVSH
ncbi:MAG: hypothetical protein NUV47_03535 [Patescibacteria group bacterium]|nr:hypothetical protein [Patescibacteria group bacterium]